jgi:HK97 family phage prohead protease
MTEVRRYVQGAELRASADDNTLVINARAIKYGALSLPNVPCRGGKERIARGAFRDSLASGQDVLALYQHDGTNNPPLGRTKNGSLKITDKDDGLYYQIRLNPAVQFHKDIHALVRDGSIDECSFGFQCEDDDWSDEKDENGDRYNVRTVRKARLLDCSLVLSPAYSEGATNATARNISYRFAPASAEPVRNLNVERCFLSPVEMLSNRSRAKMQAVRIKIDARLEEQRQLLNDFSPAGQRRFKEYFEERYQSGAAEDPQQTMRCRGGSLSASSADHQRAVTQHRELAKRAKDLESGCRHHAAADAHELAAVSSTRANDALVACRAAMQPSASSENKA